MEAGAATVCAQRAPISDVTLTAPPVEPVGGGDRPARRCSGVRADQSDRSDQQSGSAPEVQLEPTELQRPETRTRPRADTRGGSRDRLIHGPVGAPDTWPRNTRGDGGHTHRREPDPT